MNHTATKEGVEDAFSEWLYWHSVSVPEMFQDAIKDAFKIWLDENREMLMKVLFTKREAWDVLNEIDTDRLCKEFANE